MGFKLALIGPRVTLEGRLNFGYENRDFDSRPHIPEGRDQLAKRLGKTRSQLYQEAVNEYLLRHDGSEITRALDQSCEVVDTAADPPAAESSRRLLYRSEW